MKCCVEYRRVMEVQEEILETLVTAFDEIHEHLRISLQDLSGEHPAGAAARIGRCLQILEQSRHDAMDVLSNEEEDEDDE